MEQNGEPRNKPSCIWSDEFNKGVKLYDRERTVSSKNVARKVTATCKRTFLVTLYHIQKLMQWIKDVNNTLKTGEKLHDTGFDNDFLDMTPKTQATKAEIDYIKLKNFCTSKETTE